MTTLTQPEPTSQAIQNLHRAATELSVVANRARQTADLIPPMLDDFTSANRIRATGHTVHLWEMARRIGALQNPPAPYAAEIADQEIRRLRDRATRQEPEIIAHSANRAIAMMTRLLVRALEQPLAEAPPDSAARYPIIIRLAQMPNTPWRRNVQVGRNGARPRRIPQLSTRAQSYQPQSVYPTTSPSGKT